MIGDTVNLAARLMQIAAELRTKLPRLALSLQLGQQQAPHLTYGRPVLVGRTASQAFPGLPQVFPYENPHDIVRHLERLAFSDFEQEEPYTSVTMPRNSYETLVSVLPRR